MGTPLDATQQGELKGIAEAVSAFHPDSTENQDSDAMRAIAVSHFGYGSLDYDPTHFSTTYTAQQFQQSPEGLLGSVPTDADVDKLIEKIENACKCYKK